MDYSEHLRRLSIDDDQPEPDPVARPDTSLDTKTLCLVRLAALIAVGAAEPSIHREVDRAIGAGADAEDVVQVLDSVTSIVGRPRVVIAAPRVAAALGDDLDLLNAEE